MKYSYKGEKLRGSPMRRADEWNQIVDAVHQVQRSGAGPSFAGGTTPTVTIGVRNDTGLPLAFGSVLAISGVPIAPATDLNLFKYGGNAYVTGGTPAAADAGKFVITTGPIPAAGYGRAVISGVARVQISVGNEGHGFADVSAGDTTKLLSGDTGSAKILYKESDTGTKWAVVVIGGGGASEEPHPFKLLATAFDSGTLANTFRVKAGTLNALHPSNDDSQPLPIDIVIPQSSTLYKVWLDITLAANATTPSVIDHGLNGWRIADGDATDFPVLPDVSLSGAHSYQLLAEITTTAQGAWKLIPTVTSSLQGARYDSTSACNGGVVTSTRKFAVWRV